MGSSRSASVTAPDCRSIRNQGCRDGHLSICVELESPNSVSDKGNPATADREAQTCPSRQRLLTRAIASCNSSDDSGVTLAIALARCQSTGANSYRRNADFTSHPSRKTASRAHQLRSEGPCGNARNDPGAESGIRHARTRRVCRQNRDHSRIRIFATLDIGALLASRALSATHNGWRRLRAQYARG